MTRVGAARLRMQYAALPYRLAEDGQPRVLLVTSRGAGRWVLPKGWPERKLTPAGVAALEAYEEAGLTGRVIGRRPVGTYRYVKRTRPDEAFDVTVFLMQVEQQLKSWPERRERRTSWFEPREAAAVVSEPGLAEILRRVAGGIAEVLDDVLNGPAEFDDGAQTGAGRGPGRHPASGLAIGSGRGRISMAGRA